MPEFTQNQFNALVNFIYAAIEARAVRNSSGPHVNKALHAEEHARSIAQMLLVEGMALNVEPAD